MAIFRATVAGNIDDQGLGRIQVRIKQPFGTRIEDLPTAHYCSPFGGGDNVDGAGFFFVPEVGSQVWLFNEDDDPNSLYWFGSSFYGEEGRQNPPIEVQVPSLEPTLRMIKSSTGHRLEFDDRIEDHLGNPSGSIRLASRNGDELVLDRGANRGIRLGFGETGAELRMTKNGAKLSSDSGAGLYLKDKTNSVLLTDKSNTGSLQFVGGKSILYAERGIKLDTPSSLTIVSNKGLSISAPSGKFELSSANQVFISTGDTIFQNGGLFSANAAQYHISGQAGANFILELPLPGDGSQANGGALGINNEKGNIVIRNGISQPSGFSIDTDTLTNNDVNMSAGFLGRIGLGVDGNALLEGASGGLYIYEKAQNFSGSAQGLSGRTPTPLSPISGHQPIVLGDNMLELMGTLIDIIDSTFSKFQENAATISTGMTPNVLAPPVLAQLIKAKADIAVMKQTYMGASGTPTNILSGLVYADG